MKTCTTCLTEKPFSEFYKREKGFGGVGSLCKSCTKDYARKNKDALNARSRNWKAKNQGYIKSYNEQYRKNNAEIVKNASKNWRNANRSHKTALENKRRASKLNATPPWLSKEHYDQINLIYAHAKECEMLTGDKYHVDHIVPLQGENVSGLHVPWNLQVLPADLNIKKSNSHG